MFPFAAVAIAVAMSGMSEKEHQQIASFCVKSIMFLLSLMMIVIIVTVIQDYRNDPHKFKENLACEHFGRTSVYDQSVCRMKYNGFSDDESGAAALYAFFGDGGPSHVGKK